MLKKGRLFDKSSEELLPHTTLRRNGTDFVLDSKYALLPRTPPPGFGDNAEGIPESMRNRPAGGQWLKILCYDHVLRRYEFQAKPEQLNHWKFSLPKEFAEQIRKRLREAGIE